jgi:hypothetical protein
VAVDQRGYNDSDKPPSVSDYRLAQLAADVQAVVKALGHESCTLVAHDWGGLVAWTVGAGSVAPAGVAWLQRWVAGYCRSGWLGPSELCAAPAIENFDPSHDGSVLSTCIHPKHCMRLCLLGCCSLTHPCAPGRASRAARLRLRGCMGQSWWSG